MKKAIFFLSAGFFLIAFSCGSKPAPAPPPVEIPKEKPEPAVVPPPIEITSRPIKTEAILVVL